ncbi:MAG: hypothetical protein KGH94_02985 [Candidatus Micrarchaeota archaeon]|nr:hypothetical protein [Candidatus Micrarchaeota archaeon]
MEETMQFKDTGWNLKELSEEMVQKLLSEGYDTHSNSSGSSIVIQAKKDGILRDIITANRAFTIVINGEPNDFSIRVGVGKLVQNLGVAAAEALLLSELFLVVDVPEMLWTQYVHNGIVKDIETIVGGKPDKRTMGSGRAAMHHLGAAGRRSKRAVVDTGKTVVRGTRKGIRKVKRKITAMAN